MKAMPYPSRTLLTKNTVNAITVFWAILGFGLSVFYPTSDWQALLGVLMVSQAFSGRLTWIRFRRTEEAILPDFLTMYLFSQFGFKTLTAIGIYLSQGINEIGMAMGGIRESDEAIPFEYQFQAEVVFLAAMLIFTFVWYKLERNRMLAVWYEPPSKIIWNFYAITMISYIVLGYFEQSLGLLRSIFNISAIGTIALLLGGKTAYSLGRGKSWLSILALMPLLMIALRSGMKAEVILVLMPILLPVFRKRMTPLRFSILAGVIVILVLFVLPFSQVWRDANWYRQENASISDVASTVAGKWDENGLLQTAMDSTAAWLLRGSSSAQGGLVMQLADRDGLIGPVLIEGLVSIFVPRFLWPDKPKYMPGAWFTWYLGKAESPETATTSTAMMLPTELYWMFGEFGVIVGMVVIAFLYFYTYKYIFKISKTGVFPVLSLFYMLIQVTTFESSHTIYVLSSPAILIVYTLGLDKLQKTFFPKLSIYSGR